MNERFENVDIDKLERGDVYLVEGVMDMYNPEAVILTEKGKVLKDGYEPFDKEISNLDKKWFTGAAYRKAA